MSIVRDTIYIGTDIGSVSIKVGLITHQDHSSVLKQIQLAHTDLFEPIYTMKIYDGTPIAILVSKYYRIKGEPLRAALHLLQPIIQQLPDIFKIALAATGNGGKIISQTFEVPYENEFQAIARGVSILYPKVHTVLEIGGDSSKYILLDKNPNSGVSGILDYEVNGDCAAGTGSFIDQQASRLLYNIEEVGDIVIQAGKAANIAGRCSVFAKSDMIHAQQKGYQPPEILKGLCQAVVRNFKGTIIKGKDILPPVAFIGGLAANKGIVAALKDVLKFNDDSLLVPDFYAWMEAIGAAFIVSDLATTTPVLVFRQKLSKVTHTHQKFETLPPLQKDDIILLRNQINSEKQLPSDPDEKIDVYLGIDIGSVTTKLALIDEAGDLIKGIYTKTLARPIEVVKAGLKEIKKEFGEKVNIKGVGTTGSGRELIGELVGADIIKDEITAHKTGAMHISKIYTQQQVDTIFDIGGQDSKYISIEDGIVVDFTMNEACAAGTGSFLEEQAEKLGINIKNEFADLAFQSRTPIRLGERCTVFMEKEITPFLQRGADKKDIVAGLAYSIVTNYLNRVVRGRKIGNHIYFQGGTAYNNAVAAAFATVLKKKIIVPPHNGILGAIGVALLARDFTKRSQQSTTFWGFDLDKIKYQLKSFTCKGCTNFCDIQEFTVNGKKTYWGDKCSERYRKEIKLTHEPVIPDLIKLREQLLLESHKERNVSSPSIGIPRSMYFYDQIPFWSTYFQEIGFRVVLSDETNRQIVHAGVESRVAEPCFPITVAHGHIANLIDKKVDFLFIPNVIDAETRDIHTNSYFCPWGQTLCFVIKFTPKFMSYKDKILAPNIRYRFGKDRVKKDFHEVARILDVPLQKSNQAIDSAYEVWNEFQRKLKQLGRQAINTVNDVLDKAIILIGRPYNIYDPIINLNIPNKLRTHYGINTIPLDFLPIDDIDIRDINENMYWNYGQKIIKTARWSSQFENFHLIYITNFKCGPDSYIKHYVREAAKKPYLTIQFDEHGNDAGIITRCEAYLDSKGFMK